MWKCHFSRCTYTSFSHSEQLYGPHNAGVHPLWLMGAAYFELHAMSWEFGCGVILSHFHTYLWGYSEFHYNFMGLITLEYAPLWLMGGVYFELLMSCTVSLEQHPWLKPFSAFLALSRFVSNSIVLSVTVTVEHCSTVVWDISTSMTKSFSAKSVNMWLDLWLYEKFKSAVYLESRQTLR